MSTKEELAEFEEKLRIYKEKIQELSDLQDEILQQAVNTHKSASIKAARKVISDRV